MEINLTMKQILIAVILVVMLIVLAMTIGWNDAGKRRVVQYASGTMTCVFEPGPYAKWFGDSHSYNDVMSFDFDQSNNGEGATIDQQGIEVQYRDGGLGAIFGITRFALPKDCPSMVKIHKEFRSNEGLAYKLIKPYVEEVANQTAGLMTSEESYAEQRNTFTTWFRTQLRKGLFKTRTETVVTTEQGKEYCLDEDLLTPTQKKDCAEVPRTKERIPVIDDRDIATMHQGSDLQKYNIAEAGLQLQKPGYEKKTMDQISDKRDATMGVITAKANAERAKAQAIEEEQKGIKARVTAFYTAEKKAQQEIVDAEKLVKIAVQGKLEAEQKAEAAAFYKQEQILKGQGEAERKRLVMNADGALQQKLDAWTEVNKVAYAELAKQKWVPEVTMGSTDGSGNGAGLEAIMNMLAVGNAKQLGLDMSMKATPKRKRK